MNLQEIKEKINLIEYARDYHGLVCNSKGKAKCPFHPPDNHPSFTISFDEGIWKWYDPHDETGGTIVDFECKFAKCTNKQAIERILRLFERYLKSSNEGSAGLNFLITLSSHGCSPFANTHLLREGIAKRIFPALDIPQEI